MTPEQQQLIDFFAGLELPPGPQHVNPYSVFLNLPRTVITRLADLHSEVETTQQSAAVMLQEVKEWLLNSNDKSDSLD